MPRVLVICFNSDHAMRLCRKLTSQLMAQQFTVGKMTRYTVEADTQLFGTWEWEFVSKEQVEGALLLPGKKYDERIEEYAFEQLLWEA